MRDKILLLVLPLAAITAPANAQDVVYAPGTGAAEYSDTVSPYYNESGAGYDNRARMGSMAGRLSDPVVQDSVGIMVERMAGAVLNMPIDGITEAIETARPGTVKRQLRRGATVADVAGRDARYLPEELGDQSRAAVGMMGGVARAMANMMPAIENLGRDMQNQIDAAKYEARRARDR
ncbi:hypothetical protein [Sphingorhabdus sp.]|uniref:hypothetical protein n=1 Tax=Sphingorhabdus sp. TaxID=1902408 RepID=UPI00391D5DDF